MSEYRQINGRRQRIRTEMIIYQPPVLELPVLPGLLGTGYWVLGAEYWVLGISRGGEGGGLGTKYST